MARCLLWSDTWINLYVIRWSWEVAIPSNTSGYLCRIWSLLVISLGASFLFFFGIWVATVYIIVWAGTSCFWTCKVTLVFFGWSAELVIKLALGGRYLVLSLVVLSQASMLFYMIIEHFHCSLQHRMLLPLISWCPGVQGRIHKNQQSWECQWYKFLFLNCLEQAYSCLDLETLVYPHWLASNLHLHKCPAYLSDLNFLCGVVSICGPGW